MMGNSKIDIKNAGFRFGKLDTSCDQSYKLSSIRNRFNKKMYVLSSIRNRFNKKMYVHSQFIIEK